MARLRPWYRAGRGWYVTVDGNQLPLGVNDPNNESAAWAAFQELLSRLRGTAPGDPRTVDQAAEQFLAEKSTTNKPGSIKRYRQQLKRLRDTFGAVLLAALDPAAVDADSKLAAWSPTTRSHYLSLIEAFLRWIGKPHKFRKPPKSSAGAGRVIPPEIHERCLCVCNIGDWRQVLRFLWLTGCRPSEAAAVAVDNVDWAAGVVKLVEHKTAGKTGRARLIYLCPESIAVLREQFAKWGTGFLFRGQGGVRLSRQAFVMKFTRLSERVRHHVTAYGYRHTFATRALEKGIPDAQVAALLGHTGTAMLFKHYSHLIESARVLKGVAAKLNEPPNAA